MRTFKHLRKCRRIFLTRTETKRCASAQNKMLGHTHKRCVACIITHTILLESPQNHNSHNIKHHKRYRNMLFLNSAINKAFGHSDDQAMGKSNKNNVSWSCGAMALPCLRHGHHHAPKAAHREQALRWPCTTNVWIQRVLDCPLPSDLSSPHQAEECPTCLTQAAQT